MFEFDGILLKPCLFQPCFHVAGSCGEPTPSGRPSRHWRSGRAPLTRRLINPNIYIYIYVCVYIYIYIYIYIRCRHGHADEDAPQGWLQEPSVAEGRALVSAPPGEASRRVRSFDLVTASCHGRLLVRAFRHVPRCPYHSCVQFVRTSILKMTRLHASIIDKHLCSQSLQSTAFQHSKPFSTCFYGLSLLFKTYNPCNLPPFNIPRLKLRAE